MKTPICDFVKKYQNSAFRFHMPGHKGKPFIGIEKGDITEVAGADSLYEAQGIIAESEKNAAALFGSCNTFYSTEGSSHCIRAMLYLAMRQAATEGKAAKILAFRNVHAAFISAAALLDTDVVFYEGGGGYLTCETDLPQLEKMLQQHSPTAVYLTSPDYLGNIAPIEEVSRICKKYNALLLVDNAHGAYLRFLNPSAHPLSLGADACCDSAHKTLPVVTGGAYLHIAPSAPKLFCHSAKEALALFGSTSPSYLTLQSLDMANAYLADGYAERLTAYCEKVWRLKKKIRQKGLMQSGAEPLKITLMPKSYGYSGTSFAEKLREKNIECEFCDSDYVVLMLTPENGEDILSLEKAIEEIPPLPPILIFPPGKAAANKRMSPREVLFSSKEKRPVQDCEGRIFAGFCLHCPPAVPLVLCGEEITAQTIEAMKYYGITHCEVVAK